MQPMQHIGASHVPGSFCWCMQDILPLAYFITTYSDNILAKQLPEIYWDSDILSKISAGKTEPHILYQISSKIIEICKKYKSV